MLFLDGVNPKTQEVMPLNFLYFNEHNYQEDDVLSVVYKDVGTGKILVQNITKPNIVVWIVKKEYRQYFRVMRIWSRKEYLEPYTVRYRNRWKEIAKILKLDDPNEAKVSPYVFMADFDIRRYYAVQFAIEYKLPEIKKLNVGFFDIENDIIDLDRFPRPGEVPISLVTFVDASAKLGYTLILEPQNSAYALNPKTNERYDYRESVRDLKEHQQEFLTLIHDTFDESYPGFEYNLLFFDSEVKLIKTLFNLFEISQIDYAMAWNLPYDMGHLVARPTVLGEDAIDTICSNKFKILECQFTEDPNPNAHKRKHQVQISHPTTFLDQMVIYAGIRSGQGRLPSLKLNAIARDVLHDEKLNYEEDGDLRHLPYTDFKKYVLYNIKDVLLQYGIHMQTRDIDDVYMRMSSDGLLPNEIFTSVQVLTNSFTKFLYEHDYIIGMNRNRIFAKMGITSDSIMRDGLRLYAEEDNSDEDPDDMNDEESGEDDGEDYMSEGNESAPPKRHKKQFEGALVQDPNRMQPTGVKLNGVDNSKIHDFVVDEDVTAEYPTAIINQNLSPESLIGKVEFEDDMYDFFYRKYGPAFVEERRSGIRYDWTGADYNDYLFHRLPMYNYTMINDDAKSYKLNISDTVMMMYAENSITQLAEVFMGVPQAMDLVRAGVITPKMKS